MSDELFGKYEILGRLNTGGMGEILLARQKGVAGSERTVIIKMMLPHLISDPEFVDRFTDESRIAASLAHGNIVQVFESGCWEGRFYMVMEFVDGPDLKDVLTRVGRDVDLNRWLPFTVHVLSETAKALTYAYNRRDENDRPMRVVHRDVSPSNILVSRQGLVKLTDFGVAKATGRTSVTMPGKLHGKVCYMAPEQVRGMECDHRSDVFSLGVIGYEMLSGRRPFDADSDVGVLEKIRSMTFVDLAEAAPAVPAELCAIVSKAMAADPDSRWQTSEEFSAALLGWAHASGISLMSAGIESIISEYFGRQSGCAVNGPSIDDLMANAVDGLLRTPTSPPSRTGTVSRPIESTPTPAPAPARRTTGRRWPIFAGLAVIIALLLGWFLMSDRSDGPEPVVNPPPAALPDGFVAADAGAVRAAQDAVTAESDESTVSDEG
nr:serine/threonine protein kinase [Myxococcota bacterium]